MSDAERFMPGAELDNDGMPYPVMDGDSSGDWVRHEAFATLQRELSEVKVHHSDAFRRWQEAETKVLRLQSWKEVTKRQQAELTDDLPCAYPGQHERQPGCIRYNAKAVTQGIESRPPVL